MSFAAFLTTAATLQRAPNGPDGGGAPLTGTFTNVASLSCALWPAASATAVVFQKFTIRGSHVIALATNPGALPGDRVLIGTAKYRVLGLQSFANPLATAETVFLIDAETWK